LADVAVNEGECPAANVFDRENIARFKLILGLVVPLLEMGVVVADAPVAAEPFGVIAARADGRTPPGVDGWSSGERRILPPPLTSPNDAGDGVMVVDILRWEVRVYVATPPPPPVLAGRGVAGAAGLIMVADGRSNGDGDTPGENVVMR